MAVKARITAIKGTTESIVARESTKRVHVDVATDTGLTVEVIVRADGRTAIEVKQDRQIIQSLNLREDGTRAFGSVVDGKANLL